MHRLLYSLMILKLHWLGLFNPFGKHQWLHMELTHEIKVLAKHEASKLNVARDHISRRPLRANICLRGI